MSIDGRNAIWGSTFTVYRATNAPAPGGEVTRTWAVVIRETRAVFEALTDELVQKLYGREPSTKLRIKIARGLNVRPDDGIVVTVGDYAGERFRVTAAVLQARHLEVGLASSEEVFT